MSNWILNIPDIHGYTVKMQEMFPISLSFALKTYVELLSLTSQGRAFHNKLPQHNCISFTLHFIWSQLNPNLDRIFRGSFCGGSGGIKMPCLKLVRITLGT